MSAFIIVAFLIGVVGSIGMINMDNIYNIDLVGVNAMANLKSNLLEVRSNLLSILDPQRINDLQANKDNITAMETKNNEFIVE